MSVEDAWNAVEQADKDKEVEDIKTVCSYHDHAQIRVLCARMPDAATKC